MDFFVFVFGLFVCFFLFVSKRGVFYPFELQPLGGERMLSALRVGRVFRQLKITQEKGNKQGVIKFIPDFGTGSEKKSSFFPKERALCVSLETAFFGIISICFVGEIKADFPQPLWRFCSHWGTV